MMKTESFYHLCQTFLVFHKELKIVTQEEINSFASETYKLINLVQNKMLYSQFHFQLVTSMPATC